MSVEFTLELSDRTDSIVIQRAVESYRIRVQNGIERTQRRLQEFEQRYQVTTEHFLEQMSAEDLEGGDIEYIEWAGEAKLLAGLVAEDQALKHVRYKLPLKL